MKRARIGDSVSARSLLTIESNSVRVPDAAQLVHLQFRRFAGCPFCSVHLRSFERRYAEIEAAGVKEVLLFRSTALALHKHYRDTPFAIVADPAGEYYAEFGVRTGLRSILSQHPLLTAVPNIIRMLPGFPGVPFSGKGIFGLPADFLISREGGVIALKYGKHADDQWSVDELLILARQCVPESVYVNLSLRGLKHE